MILNHERLAALGDSARFAEFLHIQHISLSMILYVEGKKKHVLINNIECITFTQYKYYIEVQVVECS